MKCRETKGYLIGATMPFRMNRNDFKILESLAEYRTLTPTQITAFYEKSKQVVWRRLRILENEGLIQPIKREFGRSRGRPENSVGLTEHGFNILKDKRLIGTDELYEKACAVMIHRVDHQLLLNWFRIHLNQAEKILPRLSIKVLGHNSPFLPKGPKGRVFITDYSPVNGTGAKEVRFMPDAVFCTNDSVKKKACLFFLEVDCGTETIASPKRDIIDIRQKIVNYGAYFDSGRYKRYEEVFKHRFGGFRLLFLTNTVGRLTALCRLTQEMPSTDYVWLTESSQMFADGVSAAIWARGGNLQATQQSILGSLCCRASLSEACISKFSKTPL